MKSKSKPVLSDQTAPHRDLLPLLKRYRETEYLRPLSPEIEVKIREEIQSVYEYKGIVLDSCCGVGESTYNIAEQFPDYLILGVDKSESRLSRQNSFKKIKAKNVILAKGNILDYWCFFYLNKKQFPIKKVFLFFPNPYPKASQLKKRWHGQPVFLWLLGLDCEIELRTNWKIYCDEFELVARVYGNKTLQICEYNPEKTITPFERKYLGSDHSLYKCSTTSNKGELRS